MYQPITLNHNHTRIFPVFDATPSFKVRSVFLDISKAFDKVWHEGLLYKLNSVETQVNFIN